MHGRSEPEIRRSSPEDGRPSQPEIVADVRRRRLLGAATRALAEHGRVDFTVADIVADAGVSTADFYANFADLRDCVLAAHQAAFGRLMAEITRACATESLWPGKVRAALGAVFVLAARDPARVRLLTLGAVRLDPEIGRQIRDRDVLLVSLLRRGRSRTRRGPSLPDLTEEILIGGITFVLDDYLRDSPRPGHLADLETELAQLLLTPYVGAAEASCLATSGDGSADCTC